METTKIAAYIKASVLRPLVINQLCERTAWWQQATTGYTCCMHHLMSLVLSLGTHREHDV